MKLSLTLSLWLFVQVSMANMASPIRQGTLSGSAFSSRDIAIQEEHIRVTLLKDHLSALFQVAYTIRTDTSGRQIPLLFHALDYRGNFQVWVDEQEVTLMNIPTAYTRANHSPFEKFADSFIAPSQPGEPELVAIQWQKHTAQTYPLSDLKYFEIDLPKGDHHIRVQYTANAWTDISDWVKQYSFRYSLSPARHWHSFGTLIITTDASALPGSVSTTLGPPQQGNVNDTATWKFTSLPADYFSINYTPSIGRWGSLLVAIGPMGLTLLMTLILISLHYFSMKKYRMQSPNKKYSWVAITGSIAMPLLILLSYLLSFALIDRAIGPEAGRYHGYTFLVLIFYPLLVAIYAIMVWIMDRSLKRKNLPA